LKFLEIFWKINVDQKVGIHPNNYIATAEIGELVENKQTPLKIAHLSELYLLVLAWVCGL